MQVKFVCDGTNKIDSPNELGLGQSSARCLESFEAMEKRESILTLSAARPRMHAVRPLAFATRSLAFTDDLYTADFQVCHTKDIAIEAEFVIQLDEISIKPLSRPHPLGTSILAHSVLQHIWCSMDAATPPTENSFRRLWA